MLLHLSETQIAVMAIGSIFGAIWAIGAGIHWYDKLLERNGWPRTDPWWGFPGWFTTIVVSAVLGFSVTAETFGAVYTIYETLTN